MRKTFTVDTHLFRELGELLVGRDSTALVELIKNAYDADATTVTVDAHSLDDPEQGRITITDDGVGMTPDQFQRGFLTIASRMKEEGERRSKRFGRRFIGAKGIGRLAAHKLARKMRVYSIPSRDLAGRNAKAVEAFIDWDIVEAQQTLDDLANCDAIQVTEESVPPSAKSGTTIELQGLRRRWREQERTRFRGEVETFSVPDALIHLPSRCVDAPLLFDVPNMTDTHAPQNDWQVILTGDLETGEDYWQSLAHAAQWLVEIDAREGSEAVKVNVLPTRAYAAKSKESSPGQFAIPHPDPEVGPFFQSRILIRGGRVHNNQERTWLGHSCGIRVYMEGFRVLPYGEPSDDWLSLDADYKARFQTLQHVLDGEPVEYEGHSFLGKRSHFGAVFLTLSGARGMRMLVNREGFVPEGGYDTLRDLLRKAIYLSVRVRAAASRPERLKRREARKARPEEEDEQTRRDLRARVEESVKRAQSFAREARVLAAKGDIESAQNSIDKAALQFTDGAGVADKLMTEGAILRVLASVGTQMSAFVHEIRGLLSVVVSVEKAISKLRNDPDLSASARKNLGKLHGAVGDLRRSVERHASYLLDVTSPDARRRRSRQKIRERFDAGMRLVEPAAERRGIQIHNEIPAGLKSLPMFPAELTLVFSNLLTNAIKAAGEGGVIRASAGADEDNGVRLLIENTGMAVELERAERWFQPFESTTVETDPVLGQGMGMGLPITRNMLEDYGGSVEFVEPSPGFASAVAVTLPK